MSVLGVVCVALWLVPACGHRVVNGQAAEVEIQHVIHQDGVEATTKTVVAAAATGMTLPKLKKILHRRGVENLSPCQCGGGFLEFRP